MSVVYDSSRPELDEARRAWPGVRFVFQGGFLSVHSHLLLSTWLNELVLFFAHHQYWTRRGAHDALGRAADAKMPPARVSMGGDDDQIDVKVPGGLGDLVRRVADAHEGSNRMRAVCVRFGRQRGEIFFRHRELIFISEYFDGERRANHGGCRLDHV